MASVKSEKPVGTTLIGQACKEPAAKASEGISKTLESKCERASKTCGSKCKKGDQKPQESKKVELGKGGKSGKN